VSWRSLRAPCGTVLGVITGRALYEGTLNLRSAQALLQPN
jgi:phosphoribosylformimino-5-aminoimidazole carboxamide ribonucleotide (ProFAR) isomerase